MIKLCLFLFYPLVLLRGNEAHGHHAHQQQDFIFRKGIFVFFLRIEERNFVFTNLFIL